MVGSKPSGSSSSRKSLMSQPRGSVYFLRGLAMTPGICVISETLIRRFTFLSDYFCRLSSIIPVRRYSFIGLIAIGLISRRRDGYGKYRRRRSHEVAFPFRQALTAALYCLCELHDTLFAGV